MYEIELCHSGSSRYFFSSLSPSSSCLFSFLVAARVFHSCEGA